MHCVDDMSTDRANLAGKPTSRRQETDGWMLLLALIKPTQTLRTSQVRLCSHEEFGHHWVNPIVTFEVKGSTYNAFSKQTLNNEPISYYNDRRVNTLYWLWHHPAHSCTVSPKFQMLGWKNYLDSDNELNLINISVQQVWNYTLKKK